MKKSNIFGYAIASAFHTWEDGIEPVLHTSFYTERERVHFVFKYIALELFEDCGVPFTEEEYDELFRRRKYVRGRIQHEGWGELEWELNGINSEVWLRGITHKQYFIKYKINIIPKDSINWIPYRAEGDWERLEIEKRNKK